MQNSDCSSVLTGFTQLGTILRQYADTQGSLIAILQKTQDLYGYISEDAIRYIACKTGITEAKIYGVLTFYTQFRMQPIGTNLIMLCEGTACHVNAAAGIEEAISERLGITNGQTTVDGLFTLDVVACLGCCSLAPVMMVKSPDGDQTYGSLTKKSVVAILEQIAGRSEQAAGRNGQAAGRSEQNTARGGSISSGASKEEAN